MTEEEARAQLEAMVSPTATPVLTSDEVDALLAGARRADRFDAAPSDTGWVPTWDLRAAAVDGWLRKAGKVAGLFPFSTDGQSYQRHEMHRMCLEQAAQYRRGAFVSIQVCGALGLVGCPDVAVNVNGG